MALVAASFHWTANADGTLDGAYPAGDKPPDVADLAWDVSALAALVAGFPYLDTGTPTSVNARSALTGTNAASATIAFSNYTGDEPVSEGWAAPGAGNNLTHDGVAGGSGSFQLRATYSGDSVDSATIPWTYGTAADYPISSGTSTYDAVGVPPGSTITIPTGTRGTLKIKNAQGTAGNRITIRGPATGQAIIRRSSPASGNFILLLWNCAHVTIDGSTSSDAPLANDGKRHSIKIMHASTGTTDAPTAFLKFRGNTGGSTYTNCHDITLKQIEIDGGWPTNATDGIGIMTNDNAILAASFPGQFQENIVIEHCYIQRCQGEGMYIGNNPYDLCVPLKNITIRYNYAEDCGWNFCNPKSWYEGTNLVHDNISLRCGSEAHAAQAAGMALICCKADIYNNWIEDAGEQGIKAWNGGTGAPTPATYASFALNIYNNVIIGSGQLFSEDGIDIMCDAGYTPPLAHVYNNTIVDTAAKGITFGSQISSSSWARNNIVLNSGSTAVDDGPGTSSDNTTTGNPATIFTNYAGDVYALAAAIPASGTVGVDIAATDYAGTARPQGATSDRGAYEHA